MRAPHWSVSWFTPISSPRPASRRSTVERSEALACGWTSAPRGRHLAPGRAAQRHQQRRFDARAERIRLAGRQHDDLARPEAAHSARHQHLEIAFEALDRALVVDMVLRDVVPRRQHEMEQLDALALQKARADGI